MSMTHDEMIAVIQAHKEGKEIQCKQHGPADSRFWGPEEPGITWNFQDLDYRIKPEPPKPREWWLVMDANQPIAIRNSQLPPDSEYIPRVHVREVLP